MKGKVTVLLIDIFDRMNMDIPHNFNEILEFVVEDVKKTADKETWYDEDVVIGFRRWIEAQSDNQP